MNKTIRYHIIITGLSLIMCLVMAAPSANAQVIRNTPTEVDMYCSGVVLNKAVSNGAYVISGENSQYKSTFNPGDPVYVNRGSDQRVNVGDQFDVVRPVTQVWNDVPWFKFEATLSRAMGTTYEDVGRLRVIHVEPKVSIAEISLGCGLMQRGDIVLPFAERPAPQFHAAALDPFAAPSGKKTAMVVNTKAFGTIAAAGSVVYINLGSGQGVQAGDYFRVFRYAGTHYEALYQSPGTAYMAYGFGSAPAAYQWNNLPRQILGEGIVVRTGQNSSTVLLTAVRRGAIYIGDYVELE